MNSKRLHPKDERGKTNATNQFLHADTSTQEPSPCPPIHWLFLANEYHCHLSYHWVACWRHEKETIEIEVYYAGSRENAGPTRHNISDMENDRRPIGEAVAERLAAALGLPVSVLQRQW